jgi:peptidoglycan-N-acetylglucosamine deacetylase
MKSFILLFLCSFLYSQDFQQYFPQGFIEKKSPALHPIAPTVVQHGSRTVNQIALTFDACANEHKSKFDKKVADILIEQKIPATIFISGKWALEHQEELRTLSANTFFEFGNHSFIHPHCAQISQERFENEIETTQNIIYTLTGKTPAVFRAPYGEYNDSMVQVLGKKGLTLIEYDLPSGDPDTNATEQKLISYVSSKTKNGSIIVMHINKRGWHTAEALPGIIKKLRKKNFQFVTVSELMKGK